MPKQDWKSLDCSRRQDSHDLLDSPAWLTCLTDQLLDWLTWLTCLTDLLDWLAWLTCMTDLLAWLAWLTFFSDNLLGWWILQDFTNCWVNDSYALMLEMLPHLKRLFTTIRYSDPVVWIFELYLVIKIWPNIESNTIIRNRPNYLNIQIIRTICSNSGGEFTSGIGDAMPALKGGH